MWFTPLLGGGQQQLPEVPGILRIPNTLTSQPQTAPQIDWGNPITRKLFDWQAGPWLNGFTPVNSPTRLNSYKGIAQSLNSASSQYLTKTLPNAVSGQFTMVVLCKSPTTGGSEAFISMCEPGVTNWVTVEEYVGRYWVWRQGQFSGQQSGALLTVDANWHVHVGVLGDSLAYYRDGIRYGGGEGFTSGTYTTLRIGNTQDVSGPVRYATADVALGLFFNRPLSAAEVWSISQNPWQVFQAPQKKIFTFPGIDVTTRPIADVSRVVDTPIFRKPRIKKLPSSATPLNLSHPILRGLEQGIIAGPIRNATSRNQYTVRTSIPGAAPFGRGEKLSGSTGYISAPTVADSSTAPWTYIVYGVVPSIGINCSLLVTANNFAGSPVFDRSISLSTTGAVQARIYNPSPYAYDQITTTTKTVTPGVPFIAAAVATGSELIAYLDYNKVSVGAPTTGFIYNNPFFVVGYGGAGVTQNSSSNATIAYALKLNRAITDAEWRSLFQDPWKIFKQFEKPTIVHRAPDIDVRKTPLFFAPSRKKFPSDATPLNLGHPILRGLEQGIIAGPVRNATTRNQYTVRTSIPAPAPFGVGERLSGSTGYISAPTDASSSTAPWTYIVYGVVPSIGTNCALLIAANTPGGGVYDRSLSLSASGAAQTRIYNPAPYGYGQTTTTTKTVTPGVPFIAGAVATGSEVITYLDYNKASAAAPTAGFNHGSAVLVAGYGGQVNTDSSNATIAYALKLNRAITDAEWNSLVQDPWQIFMPGVKRVLALPTFVSAWTSNISNESLYDDVDDTSTNDGDYIISSPATSGVVGDPVIFNLSKTLPQGTHTVRARAKKSATLGEVRAALLDSNNLPVGTSAWQPLSNTFRTYELAITTTGSASRVKFDTVGSSVLTGIPSNGLALYYDASNTLSYPGSGTTITDLSGRKYNGTFTNGAVFSPANGGSIRFDGTDDYVNIPGMSTSFGGSGGTFLVWLRRNGTQSVYAGVIWSRVGAVYHGLGFLDGSNGDVNQLHYAWNGYKSRVNLPEFIVPDNVWVMAVVRGYGDWGGDMTLYNSGSKFTYYNGVFHGGAINLSDLKLGAEGLIAGRYFKGNIGIAAIYDRAISDVEIEGIYNATKGRFQTYSTPNIVTNGLVLHLDAANTQSYPGTGTTWTDLSGSGNNGTLVNGPTYSFEGDGSIVFDGVNDYVNCGTGIPETYINATLQVVIKVNKINTKQALVSTYDAGTGFGLELLANNNFNFFGFTSFGVATGLESSQQGSVGNTYLVCGVFRASNSFEIYVNGQSRGTISTAYASIYRKSTIGLSLARSPATAEASIPFDGNIYAASLYNRALSASEIIQNYNALKGRFGLL